MRKGCQIPVIALGMIFALTAFGAQLDAAEIKDSESASHGDAAASYQVVDTYKYPGFKVVQFNLSVLSHYSYMLISRDEALVVDPGRDVLTYIETAGKEEARITGVFLTHSHADFVAGHRELAKATGCPIYQNASSGAGYDFKPLKEGSTIQVGEALVRSVETPGHTPDGLCGYVFSAQKKDEPELIFTGDTLFVGSVGRPDLMEGTLSAAALASMMYDTWTKKLSAAGDNAVIFPAHGAGSLCGAHLSDSPKSTIGAEKVSNPYFKTNSRTEFIATVLDGLPEAPQYFKHNAAMNKKGPEIVNRDAPLPVEAASDKTLTDPAKSYVVDLRDARKYAAGHIPNSVNIGLRGRLETWVGIMVPWGESLILCGSRDELKEAVHRLHRVGYRASKVIQMENWEKSGQPVTRNDLLSPSSLHGLMRKGEAPVIVDVRLPTEWMGLRIGTVVNLPLSHLSELSSKLDPSQPVVAVCNSAYRSSLAVGVLERKGFRKVSSLQGGSEAWIKAGLPVYGPEVKTASAAPVSASSPRREIKLPERISAAELKRLILDLPGAFELVDVRPPAQFADFNVPGATNVDIVDLLSNPAFLTGTGPLIIVDRDGSLAMAVGGILSQKTQRSIKVLYGGVEAYWAESELKSVVKEVPLGGPKDTNTNPTGGITGKTPAAAPQLQPSVPAPQPAKTKSAGC
jgi:hydroxyacylglutathione hydrolase